MGDCCDDNRFELIEAAKKDFLKNTNIETHPEEVAVLDNILFRAWQLGLLTKYATKERRYFTMDFKSFDAVRDYFRRNQDITLVSCVYVEYWYKCLYYE